MERRESTIEDTNKIIEMQPLLGVDKASECFQSFIDELPNKDGFLDFSQLKKIGYGGTHDVFIYPQNSSFVIKLNRSALKKALSVGQSELLLEAHKIAEQYIEGENSKYEELYKYFGEEHCLREKALIQKMSIEQNGAARNIEGVITIQEASGVFKNPNKKDFSVGYIEQNPILQQNKDTYDRMNNALLRNGEFSESDFLKFNKNLRSIFELVDQDKDFANSVREFLLRFKEYFEISGKFIDLVGRENVLFYQKNNKWTFQIGSVIKEENRQTMEQVIGVLEKNPQKINQDQKMKNQLMNQLALIRLLNAAGLKVGIGKIIDVQLSETQLKNLDEIKFVA